MNNRTWETQTSWSMDEVTGDIPRDNSEIPYKFNTAVHALAAIGAYNHYMDGGDSSALNELMIMHLLCVRMYLCSNELFSLHDIYYEDAYRYIGAGCIINYITELGLYTYDMTVGEYIRIAYELFINVLEEKGYTKSIYGGLIYYQTSDDDKRHELFNIPRTQIGCLVKSYENYIGKYASDSKYRGKVFSLYWFYNGSRNIIGSGDFTGQVSPDSDYQGKFKTENTGIKTMLRYFTLSRDEIKEEVLELIYRDIFDEHVKSPETWCILYSNMPNYEHLFDVYDEFNNTGVKFEGKKYRNRAYRMIMYVTFLQELGNKFKFNLHLMLRIIGVNVGYNYKYDGVDTRILVNIFRIPVKGNVLDIISALFERLILDVCPWTGDYKSQDIEAYLLGNKELKEKSKTLQRVTNDLNELRRITREITYEKIDNAFNKLFEEDIKSLTRDMSSLGIKLPVEDNKSLENEMGSLGITLLW